MKIFMIDWFYQFWQCRGFKKPVLITIKIIIFTFITIVINTIAIITITIIIFIMQWKI